MMLIACACLITNSMLCHVACPCEIKRMFPRCVLYFNVSINVIMLDLLGPYIIGCKCPAGCLVGVKILQLCIL